MASGKEIRSKIKSVQNTRKITNAMQMVAASKMRKAQDRMRAARPYSEKMLQLAANLAAASNTEFDHPFLEKVRPLGANSRIGLIVVTTDKGLCGGLNTNILRLSLSKMKEWDNAGIKDIQVACIGSKGLGFMQRLGANVVSASTHEGDVPKMEHLLGTIRVMLEKFAQDELDHVFIAYTRFINTMSQKPVFEHLLPLSGERLGTPKNQWDYLYEPEASVVVNELLTRYIEAIIYQAVSDNLASEQSARMVAMKAATDNAGHVIKELELVYNKARQAAITKEISEIVGGAAAV